MIVSTHKVIKTDICVIGAGSAGLSVAAGAAQLGADVTLLEGGEMGGDCLNYGCVPSKSLFAAAKRAHAVVRADDFGLKAAVPKVDFNAVSNHVNAVINAIAPHDSQARFEGLGVRVLREYGRFTASDRLRAGQVEIKARRFVIATGAAPVIPPIPGLADVDFLTNETIFSLRECPRRLLVIGAGPVGLELAQAFHRLGAKVSVVEVARALHREDPELTEIALTSLRGEGIEILEGEAVSAVENSPAGMILHLENGNRLEGSHLLIAAGRRPNTADLNLKAAAVDMMGDTIRTAANLRTSNRRIFAIGEVASTSHSTHSAGYQAGLVLRSAMLGLPVNSTKGQMPTAVYLDPEIAHVGLSEQQAEDRFGAGVQVVRVSFDDIDRARTEKTTTGMIKVMVVKGRPVGASIVGPQAAELIQIWSLAISQNLKMRAIAEMIAPYPTLGEINKRAAGAYFAPKLFESLWLKRLVRLVQRFT